MSHVLLLGGTAEARALSQLLDARTGLRLTCSLAGVTRTPERYGGTLRTGGFGGAEGLASYLQDNDVQALIDATHPFAATMHANAAHAAHLTHIPLLRLERPEWPVEPGWIDTPDLPRAIAALPTGATAFLATGRFSATELPVRRDVRLILRALEPPETRPEGVELILGPPARDADTEAALFRQHGTTHLVTKNSGGGRAKLDAAEALDLSVVMIRRPSPPEGVRTVADPHAALRWLDRLLGSA